MDAQQPRKARPRRYEIPGEAFASFEDAARRGERWGQSWVYRLASIGTAAGFLVLAFFLMSAVSTGPFILYGYGKGVADLQEGARVILGMQEVGTVKKISVIKGRVRATLELEAELENNLGRSTKFGSGCINAYLPGDLGVVIKPAEPRNLADILRQDDEVMIETGLFAHIPTRFWITALLCIGGIAGTVATYRFFRSILSVVAGVSALVTLIAYLYQSVGVS